ncbi:MAG: leucine--tRNA ligase, partial [Patescibacteria group bacterium]|nr:leucine--tRNA ligase [Patescibacteria group bacterium]
IKKDLEQWFFKVTAYAERLLNDLENLNWPGALKTMQRNWIGKSEGAEIDFKIKDCEKSIKVFTTRPDTLYGATYMVLAPEHDLINKLKNDIKNFDEISKYIIDTRKKSELERTELNKDKTGVELIGIKAINPVNNNEIPVFISDYVLSNYGTGAIMCVPAHDQRDFEFAKKFNLEIIPVVSPSDGFDFTNTECAMEAEGKMINSEEFNGLNCSEAKEKIILRANGKATIQYKIRDWLVSRQRYWGAPIPIIYCDTCGTVPVSESDLPVLLPDDIEDFRPTGKSPLESSESFKKVKCPICGKEARREYDTMDGFVDNSWYYYRYLDSKNEQEFCSKENMQKFMPVDCYVGGAEHAVGHLIYARFFTKVLKDNGYIDFDEPFLKLINQGLILGSDGQKMSKSRGNVVNPDEMIEEFGADSFRMYEMFMGPLEDYKAWNTDGMRGQRRFLDKNFQYFSSFKYGQNKDEKLLNLLHKTISKIKDDIENFRFNTAISAFMIYFRELSKFNELDREYIDPYLIMLSCFAPHICEEIWEKLGNKNFICLENWPSYNEKLAKDDTIKLPVQVNGKLRDTIEVHLEITEPELKSLVLSKDKIKKYIEGHEIVKFIYVNKKIVNIVIK